MKSEAFFLAVILMALIVESSRRINFPRITIYGPTNEKGNEFSQDKAARGHLTINKENYYEVWVGISNNTDEDILGKGPTIVNALVRALEKLNPKLLHDITKECQ